MPTGEPRPPFPSQGPSPKGRLPHHLHEAEHCGGAVGAGARQPLGGEGAQVGVLHAGCRAAGCRPPARHSQPSKERAWGCERWDAPPIDALI